MASAERYDAYELMRQFRPDEAALGEALTLFVERPDYGFVWLAYVDDHPAGCVSVALGIDTETGGAVATLRDCFVVPAQRRQGLASALLVTLEARLAHLEVRRLDVLGGSDPMMQQFFRARGYHDGGRIFTHRR